jgi:beta-glucosidase
MKKAALSFAALLFAYVLLIFSFRDPDASLHLDPVELRSDSLRFGRGFFWGTSTSAYQVEGNSPENNWTEFESSPALHGHANIAGGDRCGSAADQWNRYTGDILLMKSLGLNAYRFSVEWSRIEPAEGVFSDTALDHYARVVDGLVAQGIEPFITLHHFTNPLWFERRGGFLREDAPELFARFARRVVQRLGSRVGYWLTINEPAVYVLNGYITGEFPPGLRDPEKGVVVFRNLLRAHTLSYLEIKRLRPGAIVGLAVNIFPFDPPDSWYLPDVLLARLLNRNFYTAVLEYLTTGVFEFSMPGFASTRFVSGVQGGCDFIGLNYYSRLMYRFNPFSDEKFVRILDAPSSSLTDMGWEIYPDGLYRALRLVTSRTAMPVYITENGIADDSDTKRAAFIEDHLMVLNRAIRDGMNIRGYFYWSLVDNFEWTSGYGKRFGLYHVDFATQKRTLREGSKVYPAIIARGAAAR